MSFGGGGTETTTTKVDVPAWYQQAQQNNIARATTLAQRPYEMYGGPRVADWTNDQQDAFQLTRAMMGQSTPGFDEAQLYIRNSGKEIQAPGAQPAGQAMPTGIEAAGGGGVVPAFDAYEQHPGLPSLPPLPNESGGVDHHPGFTPDPNLPPLPNEGGGVGQHPGLPGQPSANPWEYNVAQMEGTDLAPALGYNTTGPAVTHPVHRGHLGNAATYAAAMGTEALGNARNGADFMGGYDNPYQDRVIDRALDDIDRAESRELSQARRRAAGAEAFGGSRTAILEGEINRNYADMRGDVISQLRKEGYDTSLQAGMADAERDADMSQFNAGQRQGLSERNADRMTEARRYAANMGNEFAMQQAGYDQQAGMADAAARNAASMDFARRRDEANRFGAEAANRFALTEGQMDQEAAGRNQDALNLARRFGLETFLGAEQANRDNAFRSAEGIMGLTGARRDANQEDVDRLFQIGELERGLRQRGMDTAYGDFNRQRKHDIEGLNLMIAALSGVPQGMFGTTTTAPGQDRTGGILGGVGSLLGGVGALGGLLSDRRLKHNIVPLGNGLYEFSYDWDPGTRHVGVMSDEVDPAFVIKGMSGFDMVNYRLMALEA